MSYHRIFRLGNVLILLLLPVLLWSNYPNPRGDEEDDYYAREWIKVDALLNKGLPKSAMEIVGQIYTRAKNENVDAQWIKAVIYKIDLVGELEEEGDESAIRLVVDEIQTAGFPAVNILHSILADLYWNYYNTHRWDWLNRTSVVHSGEIDIRKWNLKMLMDKVVDQHLMAVDRGAELRKIPLKSYDVLLVKEKNSQVVRPTLYDFLAHRAIDQFMMDETSLTKPSKPFYLDNPLYLSFYKDFSALPLSSPDSASLSFLALRLLQDLVRFHANDTNPSALVDVDLKRLSFVFNQGVIPNKDSLYIAVLETSEKYFGNDPVSVFISYSLAQQYVRLGNQYRPLESEKHKWDLKKAWQLCGDATGRFPDALAAGNCKSLQNSLLQVSFKLNHDQVVIPGKPVLGLLSYKNVKTIYWRIISMEPEKEKNLRQQADPRKTAAAYLEIKPFQSGVYELPEDGDYQTHQVQLAFPSLPPGFYIFLLSPDKDFDTEKVDLAHSDCWSTNISFIEHKSQSNGYELFTVDRETGEPLKGVQVDAFTNDYDYKTRTRIYKLIQTFTSGKDGAVIIPTLPDRNTGSYYLTFRYGKDTYSPAEYFYPYFPKDPSKIPQPKTFFFTDRAIYRPGQTIYFKGITLLEKDKGWSVQDGRKTTVTLFDVNRRKVSELELFTNEFGSFSGSFTSPSGVLNGEISISNGSGSITVSVEEYKRPRFEVKLEKPDGMYRLNTIVNVKGKAGTYSGSPVDGARVTYRVTRTARFPYWYDERGIIPSSPAMEICNGTITTDEKGEFVIPFTAIADPALSKDKQPVFNFEVRADVMDINGESQHGSTSCSVGYTSMVIETNLPGEISKDVSDTVQMKTTNLSGRPVNTRGLVKVFRLRQPEQVFKPRKWSRPDKFILSRDAFSKLFPTDLYDDEDNVTKWEKQQKTLEKSFDTSHDSVLILDDLGHWETGRYVFEITATDAFGEAVVYTRYFSVYSVKDKKVPGNVYSWFSIPQKKFEPGQTATVLFGSQVKGIHVLFEVLRDKLVVSRKWLDINKELIEIPIPVTESDRGNLGVNFILTKNNNSFQSSGVINVPRSDKELNVSIGTFRDKLMPGEDEEWQVRVSGKKGDKVAAELLISMVDASLEAIKPNRWNFSLFGLNWNFPSWQNQSAFALETSEIFYRFSLSSGTYYETYYQGYDKLIRRNPYQGRAYYNAPLMSQDRGEGAPMVKRMEAIPGDQPRVAGDMKIAKNAAVTRESGENLPTDTTEIPGAVNPRTNLRETAFFFPDLKTNENGELVVKFRVPESLTRWKVTGLAHTKDLRSGTLVKELVTSKELMVFPNFPRFLREGDKLMFSVKIVSLSKLPLKGKVNLQFFDALTMKPIDNELDNKEITLPFYLEAGQSTSVSWPISVPFGLQAVTYNLKAWTSQFSDGEEASLPVLSNRILVTEALTLPVKGKGKFDFEMKKLTGQQKGPSSTLKNHSLSLEFTSNPAWLAVQALPYLMDQTYDCSELIFNRFYANAMATWISNSNPEIHKVFERWSMFSPSALLSNLEKNRELKTVSLEETPWIVDASNESESKKRIALLFDLNRMVSEKQISLNRLQTLQTPNGGWSWFPGMPDDRYITQYIVSGLGHLSHLGILDMKKDLSVKEMMRKAVLYLDERLTEEYRRLLQYAPKTMGDNNLSNNIIQYLYARSFFTDQFVIGEESKEAVQYYKGQAAKYWTTQSPYLQGMIALGLSRMGDSGTPGEIIRSLKERAIHHPELGMYWKGSTPGYYWHQSGIGTQSLLIEAFDEIAKDQRSVEEMKIWLLKQKQTNHWNSTISTADACYALLLRGTGLLSRKQAPVIQLGRVLLDPDNDPALTMESGTGYFKTSWHDAEIQPDMGKVSITNKEEGIAWGALYWQYFENLDKITPVNGPLTVERQLFIIKDSPSGPVMEAVSDKNRIKTGDKIKVRILLSCDRDLEYVHLKDLRAAGLEPAEVLSGYRYESGLGYYKSTGDAASHYFFSFLPKGTHIFEYTLVASVKGAFSQGISTVECMYAPDFSAHTEGLQIKIE